MRNYYIIWILFTGLLSTSCHSMLDYQSDGRITMEEAFNSRVRVQGYLNSCYASLSYPGIAWASYSDEAESSDKASNSKYVGWYNGLATGASFESYSPDTQWWQYFQAIRKCNVFIANIHTATADISAEKRNGMEAQARTLRAYYYLQLIKRYGGVPIVSSVLPADHDFSNDRRASFAEVVSFILEECDKALDVPATKDGFPWEIYEQQYGIMTRAIAYAIKSQAVTFAASPLWADGTYTWDDALEITKQALYECLSNGYKLFDIVPSPSEAQNAYAYYFISNSNDRRARDTETIMRGAKMSIWRTAGLPTTTGMESAGPSPSQELVDGYEMMATGEAPITGYLDDARLIPIINDLSGYDPANPYEGRDPRFIASIYYNGAARTLDTQGEYFTPIYIDALINPATTATYRNLNIIDEGDYWDMTSTTHDPWTVLSSLTAPLEKTDALVTLEFEYKSLVDIVNPQIFYAPPLGESTSFRPGDIKASADWNTHTINLKTAVDAGWGKKIGDYLRVDWGGVNAVNFQVKKAIKIKISPLTGKGVETFVGGEEGISESGARYTVSGYYIRKFNNHKSNLSNDADGENRVFRLAELYFNFAEAAYNSSGAYTPVELGAGMSMSACDAVNAVRARAGMPDFPTGLSTEDFEKKYRNERRIEFAFEGHRFFDVRRWRILDQTDSFVTGMRITKTGDTYTYSRFRFNNRSCVSDKYYMYPIPQTEVNKMLTHTGENWQNNGW